MSYNQYLSLIEESLINGDLTETPDILESIYIIDNKYISGEFDMGCRGLDHNALLFRGYDWHEIIDYGVIVVPESKSYISRDSVPELDGYGFERLDIDDNHITGYKRLG